MVMVVVDSSFLYADSQSKSAGLVWELEAAWCCLISLNELDKLFSYHNGRGYGDSLINIDTDINYNYRDH